MLRCRRLLLIVLLLAGTYFLYGQYSKEFKRIFIDAEALYGAGFYEESFTRYKDLLNLDPENQNILFRCGACCLHIPGNETLAVEYLERAVDGVKQNYKDHSYKETGAPVSAYFLLGSAYHLTNDFEKAIAQYQRYIEAGEGEDRVQMEYAQLQIEACKRAMEVDRGQPSFAFTSLLDYFADALPSCTNPVVSGDGNILVFLASSPTEQKMMMTTRRNGLWSRPRVINSEIGMVGETYPVSLSFDGNELYLVHRYYSHSDIFLSRFEKGRWSEAEPLGHNINGRTSEIHASISRDGKSLYFTSDARGSLGSYDIFISRLGEKGEWGPAENLGPVINTPYEEHTPFISRNDSVLFFSSQGHESLGGIDVFYSRLQEDGSWSEPVNLGIPVNTSGDDLFFNPGWAEMEGYFAIRKEEDPASSEINLVMEIQPEPEGMALVEEPEEQVEENGPAPGIGAGGERIQEALEERPVTLPDQRTAVETGVKPVAAFTPPAELFACIPFDHNSYRLNLAAMVEVEKLADHLKAHPGATVQLTGHADARGSAEFNMLLSFQRVSSVNDYLIRSGVNQERILIHARGEAEPVARNKNIDGSEEPLGMYLNRMVAVQLMGPLPADAGLYGAYVPLKLRPEPGMADHEDLHTFSFTIQVMADRKPVQMSRFQRLGNVEEHLCNDQYYRYTYGDFPTAQEAKQALARVKTAGYRDAYVRTREWYYTATR